MASFDIYGKRSYYIGDPNAKVVKQKEQLLEITYADSELITAEGFFRLRNDFAYGEVDYWGRFSYTNSGKLKDSSMIKGWDVTLDDYSATVYVEDVYVSYKEFKKASESDKNIRKFYSNLLAGDDNIDGSLDGGSLFARTYGGDDVIDVNSGKNNDVDSGTGNDAINVSSSAGGIFLGGDGDDEIHIYSSNAFANGCRGNDILTGGSSNNTLRGGNGRDILDGGYGADSLFGDFGLNTFEGGNDGYIDKIYIKSDQLCYNWLYGKAGNSPSGEKCDKIVGLDPFDRIYIQGATDDQLSFRHVDHESNLGETLSGVGIYAAGALEAVYIIEERYSDLTLEQVQAMTFGAAES